MYLILADGSFADRTVPCGFWMTVDELYEFAISRCGMIDVRDRHGRGLIDFGQLAGAVRIRGYMLMQTVGR